MEEIDEGEYREVLLSLLRKKLPAIKAKNDYERNGKLIRFAAGHGYCMDEILLCLKQIGCGDDCFD
jgi:regulatory protein